MSNDDRKLGRGLISFDGTGAAAALLVLAALLWATAGERFAAPQNLLQVARQASSVGIMSVGMVVLLSMGEIDLSVASTMTLVNVLTAILLREGTSLPVAVLVGLLIGAGCGFVNGLLSAVLRIPTIIITLGTMSIYRGLALVVSNATPVSHFAKDNWLFELGAGRVLGVPTGVLMMCGVGIAGYVLLNWTRFGWRVQAIGSNAQAARFTGIPLAHYRVAAMTLMGWLAGVAGVMELAFLQSGNPTTGQGNELYVIAAAIIGGTPLAGGSGSIVGGILGALMIALIRNGLVLLDFSTYWSAVVTGSVIIIAVAVSNLVKRRGEPF